MCLSAIYVNRRQSTILLNEKMKLLFWMSYRFQFYVQLSTVCWRNETYSGYLRWTLGTNRLSLLKVKVVLSLSTGRNWISVLELLINGSVPITTECDNKVLKRSAFVFNWDWVIDWCSKKKIICCRYQKIPFLNNPSELECADHWNWTIW